MWKEFGLGSRWGFFRFDDMVVGILYDNLGDIGFMNLIGSLI